jgi:hypothetical protein
LTIQDGTLASRVAAVIERQRGIQVPLEVVRRAAFDADLGLRVAADQRWRLREMIDDLVNDGAITTPRSSALWDNSARPSLPLWVRRRPAPRARQVVPPPPAWHARLWWAASDDWSREETERLRHINAFLAAGGAQQVVPLQERSLQIFGDEKALDQLIHGRLFAPGRLSLDLLGAVRTSPPLVRHQVGHGDEALVVENFATYDSLTRSVPAETPIGWIIYGAGNQVRQALVQVPDTLSTVARLRYFGDLDVGGIEIALAARVFAADLGLPLVPASGLYRLLLDVGRPALAMMANPARAARLCREWLPDPLATRAVRLLRSGQRLAQEAVGLELLTEQSDWHDLLG